MQGFGVYLRTFPLHDEAAMADTYLPATCVGLLFLVASRQPVLCASANPTRHIDIQSCMFWAIQNVLILGKDELQRRYAAIMYLSTTRTD